MRIQVLYCESMTKMSTVPITEVAWVGLRPPDLPAPGSTLVIGNALACVIVSYWAVESLAA